MPSCSQCELWAHRKSFAAGTAGRLRLVLAVREHNFVGEERHPFAGGDAVRRRAADEFMPATGELHEFGLAKLADDLMTLTLRKEMIQFHTSSRYQARMDNRCPCDGNVTKDV